MKLVLYTDGAARGNPGPAAIGIVITDSRGKEMLSRGKAVGRMTNNEAEYRGLIFGLELARSLHADEIEIRTDSQLLAQQINGDYKVRALNLKPLYSQAQRALLHFRWRIQYIPRELNRRADALANQALDKAGIDVPLFD